MGFYPPSLLEPLLRALQVLYGVFIPLLELLLWALQVP